MIDQHWQNIDPIIVALLQTVLRLPHVRQFLIDKMDWTVCHPPYYYDQINRQYIIISTYWTLIDIGDSVGCLFNVDRNWRGASFQRVTPAMVSLTSPTSHSWKFQSVRDSVPTSLSPSYSSSCDIISPAMNEIHFHWTSGAWFSPQRICIQLCDRSLKCWNVRRGRRLGLIIIKYRNY